jgi:hypothetical protein
MKFQVINGKYVDTETKEEFVRVSTILNIQGGNDGLIQWAANCTVEWIKQNAQKDIQDDELYFITSDELNQARFHFKDVSKEALDIGGQLHDLIAQYVKAKIKGKNFDPTSIDTFRDEVENGFLAFLQWEQDNEVEWIDSEFIVYHEELGYAGRVDALCKIKGKLTLVDFKSSKGFYDGMDLQLTGYKLAYWTMNKIGFKDILDIGILRLDKKTALPEYKDYSKKYNPIAWTYLCEFYWSYKKRRVKNKITRGQK